jgi:PKD repeat protein
MSVAGYEYRLNGGSPVDVGDVLTKIISALSPNTLYSFEIRAYDAAGNRSGWSSIVSATTLASPVLDLISTGTLVVAYGLRKLKAAYAGPCIRVERSTDNTQQDVGFDGIDSLDIASALAFAGAGTLKVVKWYDQSGGGNDLAVTAANAPTLLPQSSANGKPGLDWGTTINNSIRLVSTSTVSLTAPKIFMATRQGGSYGAMMFTEFGASKFRVMKANAHYELVNGSTIDYDFSDPFATLDYLNWQTASVRASFFSGNDKMYFDGVEMNALTAGNAGDTASGAQNITLGNSVGFNAGFLGSFFEYIIVEGAISDADALLIDNSQIDYYKKPAVSNPVSIKVDSGRILGGWVGGFFQDRLYNTSSGTGDFADTVDIAGLTNPGPAALYSTYRSFTSEFPTYTFNDRNIVAGKTYMVRFHFNEGNASHVIGDSVMVVLINGAEAAPIRDAGFRNSKYFDVRERAGAFHKGYIREYLATADGSGVVTVVVRNGVNNSGGDVRVALIELLEAPPVASFTVSGSGNQTVTRNFTDTSTGSPTSWAWDFGDGASSTAQNPAHTFANAGTYVVTLTATNSHGASENYSATVTVTSQTALTLSPSTLPNAQQSVAYSQSLSTSGSGGPFTYALVTEASDARDYTDLGSGITRVMRRGALPNGLSLSSAGLLSGTPNLSATKPSLLLLGGDSLTKGFIGADPALTADYTPTAWAIKLLGRSWKGICAAVSGTTLANMETSYNSTFFSTYYNSAYEKCIFFICGGENDIIGGTSLSAMETSLQNIVTAAHTAGLKVIVGNLVINPNWVGTQLSNANSFNSWISSTLTNADQKIDWSSNVLLANQKHNTYFNDGGIHQTELGYIERAKMIKTAADAISAVGSGGVAVDYKFAVKVNDPSGNAVTREYTLTVNP